MTAKGKTRFKEVTSFDLCFLLLLLAGSEVLWLLSGSAMFTLRQTGGGETNRQTEKQTHRQTDTQTGSQKHVMKRKRVNSHKQM